MSLLSHARSELDRINFGADDTEVLMELLERFFNQWDSGGSVPVAARVLQRLIDGKPLSPLTGEPSEWCIHDFSDDLYAQNRRCSTVFQRRDGTAYDISSDARVEIQFPYMPD